jgi:hypothetical protein
MNPAQRSSVPMSRVRNILANLTLVVVSTLIGFFVIELLFFRLVLPTMPAHLRPHLSGTAGVLAQSSKAAFVPNDYIALLGDSYAEGFGDWQLSLGEDESRPYHSAHVIEQLTGRDVVSFGQGGAGSAEGLVRLPASVLAESRCAVFPTLQTPTRMFVYFYEGNDLRENLEFLPKVVSRYGSDDRAAIDRYLARDYSSFPWWKCHVSFFDTTSKVVKYLYTNLTRDLKTEYANSLSAVAALPAVNSFLVDGKIVRVPTDVHGPSLELSPDEITKALDIFDSALSWLRTQFKDVPTTIVYIPSPLSVYRNAGDTVSYTFERNRKVVGSGKFPNAMVSSNSDRICIGIGQAAARRGAAFIDARPTLRQAALSRTVHGPTDWNHLNENGYRALGEMVARRIADSGVDACQ